MASTDNKYDPRLGDEYISERESAESEAKSEESQEEKKEQKKNQVIICLNILSKCIYDYLCRLSFIF